MSSTKERRKSDRDRKADERRLRREAGIPEPALLDRVIVDALREIVVVGLGHADLRPDPVVQARFQLRELMQRAIRDLGRRGYNTRACAPVIAARFLMPTSVHTVPVDAPPTAPSQIADLKTDEPVEVMVEEAAPDRLSPDVQRMLDDLARAWAPGQTAWVPEPEEAA